MTFRPPAAGDRAALDEYVKEHQRAGENDITASLGLADTPFDDRLDTVRKNAETGSGEWGRSVCLLCFDGGRLVGLLSIRYELSPEMSDIYGDIGYGVRPSERRRGRAVQMLRHALSVCRQKGLKTVRLGCFKDNIGSSRTIERCGGVLVAENDNYQKGRMSRYYDIAL